MESIPACLNNPSLLTAASKPAAGSPGEPDAFSSLFSQALGISPAAVADGAPVPAAPDAPGKRSAAEEAALAAICLPAVPPAPQGQPSLAPAQVTAAIEGSTDSQGQSAILLAVETAIIASAFSATGGGQVPPSLIPSSSITATTSPLVTDNQDTEGDAVGVVAPQIQVAATGSGSATVSPIRQERENPDQPAPFPPGSNTIPDGGSAGREPTAPKMLEATIPNTLGNLAGQIEQWLARQEVTAAPAAPTLEPEPSLKPSDIRSQRATSRPGSQPPVTQLLLRGEMQAPPDARTVAIPQHLHQSPKVVETSYLPSGHQGGPSGRQPHSSPESVGDAFIESLSPGNLLLAPHEASPGRGHTAPSVTSAQGPVPTWQPQLVNEIASRIRLLGGAQKSGIEVNLEITQLGRIGLSAIEQDDELKLKLFTNSSQIQNTIEAHLPQIKAALAEQGIRVGHFTVQSSQDTGGSFIAGNPQHGQGQQSEQQPRHIFIGWEDRAPAEEALVQSGSAEPARANIIDYRV